MMQPAMSEEDTASFGDRFAIAEGPNERGLFGSMVRR